MTELHALGIVGKVLTGPWMLKFCVNDVDFSYYDALVTVASVIDKKFSEINTNVFEFYS